ncbi:MAG: glycosyltransferase family 4 protein, partial [Patescibacteria group bacterium]
VPWHKIIYLFPSALALIIPVKLKFFVRNNVIPAKAGIYLNRFRVKHGMTEKKTLGLIMPIGQSKEQLIKSGQWNLWQFEIEEYRKYFDGVEVFEFKYRDWRRFFEAKLMPLVEAKRFKRCSVLKAVHLSAAIPCLVAKALYKTPYVLSFGYRYDQFAMIEKKWTQWIFIKLLEPLAIRLADLVIVPTEELRKHAKVLGARNVEVIQNGVDTDLFKPASKGLTLRPQGETLLNILFVGRLELQKNLKVFIKAVSKISKGLALPKQGQALINVKFVGSGSQKEELVKLAVKLGVNLKVTDQIPNEKLPETYRQADIFVLPSLAEGHPKALLEAMSCGLACIASNIPGINEIIVDGKNGLLVNLTEEGLAEGLKRLIGDSGLRQRLGISARKTVLEKFDKKLLMKAESRLLLDIK